MILYDYFRSSASFRVRICLNLKNIPYKTETIDLTQQNSSGFSEYQHINFQGLVPSLKLEDGTLISQSLNIIEFLDKKHPDPALIPRQQSQLLKVKQISYAICCDIHPLNNLRVLNYITKTLKNSEEEMRTWYRHWIMEGFYAIEKWIEEFHSNQKFCVGDSPTMADLCLIPQVFNAKRFNVTLENYPIINNIYEHCLTIPAFIRAHPDNCKDN